MQSFEHSLFSSETKHSPVTSALQNLLFLELWLNDLGPAFLLPSCPPTPSLWVSMALKNHHGSKRLSETRVETEISFYFPVDLLPVLQMSPQHSVPIRVTLVAPRSIPGSIFTLDPAGCTNHFKKNAFFPHCWMLIPFFGYVPWEIWSCSNVISEAVTI